MNDEYDERRRYFRINETVGVSYSVVDDADREVKSVGRGTDIFDLVSAQDAQIEQLLLEVADESPKVAELITAFNQKLERIIGQLVVDNRLLGQIAHRVSEVNISACGMAFVNDQHLPEGTRLKLELELFPGNEVVHTFGTLVESTAQDDVNQFYWRMNFYGMTKSDQEQLIQHIVQRQSAQLRADKP